MKKILVSFIDWCLGVRKIKTTPAPSNYPGIPPKNLSWEDAKEYVFPSIVPLTLWDIPEVCPDCGQKLLKYRSDYQEIEGVGQYMVVGKYCEKGCYTNLDCA
jgi:hypothetical protein